VLPAYTLHTALPMQAADTVGGVLALSHVGSATKLPQVPDHTPYDANCTDETIWPAGQLRMDHRFSAEVTHTSGPCEGVTGGVAVLEGVVEGDGVLDAVVEDEGVCEAVIEDVAPKVLDSVTAAVPEALAEELRDAVRERWGV